MKINQIFNGKLSVGLTASIVYTLAMLLSKGLTIITTPIFTRIMPPDQIGIVNLYNSWYSMIGGIATLALTSGGFQLSLKEFKDERNEYVSSVLTLTSITTIILAIVYFINPSFWNEMTGLPTALMVLLLVHMFFYPAQEFWLMRQRYEYKYKSAGLFTFLSVFIATIFSIGAVVLASSTGIKELGTVRLFANYAVILLFSSVIWVWILRKGKTFYSDKYWRFSLALSLPMIGNSVAAQILNVSDRTMISKMVGNREVGIYSTLYTVSSLSLIVWSAINASFVPFLYENLSKPKKIPKIRSLSSTILLAFAIVAFLATMMAPEIVKVLATDEYYDAIYIMPPIAAGVFLTSVSNMYSNLLIYHKKTQFLMVSSIIAAVINVVLNYIGIQKFGYIAAAYTTMIAYIVLSILQAIVATKAHYATVGHGQPFVYNSKFIFVLACVTVSCCMACLLFYHTPLLRYIILIIMLVVFWLKRKIIIQLFK